MTKTKEQVKKELLERAWQYSHGSGEEFRFFEETLVKFVKEEVLSASFDSQRFKEIMELWK